MAGRNLLGQSTGAPSPMQLQQTLDTLIGRLLFVPSRPVSTEEIPQVSANAERTFNASIAVSAVRCIIQYVILPFVLPVIGVTTRAAIPISLTINIIAIGAIVLSLRRFWLVNYKGKWTYLGIASAALCLLIVFIAADLIHLSQL